MPGLPRRVGPQLTGLPSTSVYHAACRACGAESGPCASSEVAERWFIEHARTEHPERLEEAQV